MSSENFEQYGCRSREEENYTLGKKDIRRWYQRDIDQITHSTCFRKLQRKSQLLSEKDPRSRSRMIHTIEVSRIALEISEQLGLSKELTEAICLAHDIGTSPYGSIGNSFLSTHVTEPFSHEIAGAYMLLSVAQKKTSKDEEEYNNIIEASLDSVTSNTKAVPFYNVQVNISDFPKSLCGSRVTHDKTKIDYYLHHISPEIIDGVLNHGHDGKPNTLEGQVVQFADNIAYLSQDVEDLITTGILPSQDYTKLSWVKQLKYEEDEEYEEDGKKSSRVVPHVKSWEEIEKTLESCSLKDAFSETRGRRIAAFISRYVEYNLKKLSRNELKKEYSSILKEEIPVLEIDDGARFVIDFIWNFIESKYTHPLISTSTDIQKVKMSQLWTIISSSDFIDKNTCYNRFIATLTSNSLFKGCGDDWKKAFFISHLSWQDVDLIIDSYHERNYTLDLDLSY